MVVTALGSEAFGRGFAPPHEERALLCVAQLMVGCNAIAPGLAGGESAFGVRVLPVYEGSRAMRAVTS